MTFQIEKGMPVPTDGRGRASAYPFQQMEVGDSFFVPGKKAIGGSVRNARKGNNKKFVTRSVTEGDQPGVRVWRAE